MLTALTAAWFGLIAYACWFASGLLAGVLVERRRQRRHRERVCERRWNERRREYRVVLDGIAERIHYGSKL